MKQISPATLTALSQQAQNSPRQRANHNLHPQLDDPIQRLAIAMEPGTYVRPHRHPHTWELLHALNGSFIVLEFDDHGVVLTRTLLGTQENAVRMVELAAGSWHAVLSCDSGAVIFEVKHGPYQALAEADLAPWSAAADTPAAKMLMAWYATTQVGERWSA